jgi:hypothetical protein
MREPSVHQLARDTLAHLEDACSELAYENFDLYRQTNQAHTSEITDKILKLEKFGTSDIAGALADSFYEDPRFIQDIMGDFVRNLSKDDKHFNQILDWVIYLSISSVIKKVAEGLKCKPKT